MRSLTRVDGEAPPPEPARPRVGHRATAWVRCPGLCPRVYAGHPPQNLLCSRAVRGCGAEEGRGRREGRPQGLPASGRGLGVRAARARLGARISRLLDLAERMLPARYSRKGSSWVWVPPASSPPHPLGQN